MSFLWFLLWCSFCCICFSLSCSRDRCALMPSTFPLKCEAVLLSLKNYIKQTIDEILSKSFQLQVITSVNIIRSGGYLSLLVANVMCNLLQWQLGKSSPSSVTRQAKVFLFQFPMYFLNWKETYFSWCLLRAISSFFNCFLTADISSCILNNWVTRIWF